MAEGRITKRDIIDEDALNWGKDYAASIQIAINKNKELIELAKEYAALVSTYRKSSSQQDLINGKNAERIAYEKSILAIKAEEAALISAEKIKKEMMTTEKAAIELEKKKNDVRKGSVALTIEEKVQNEIANRAAKQAAREKLGLVGAYEKLNKARSESKKRLQDLIATETVQSGELRKAQREFEQLDAKVRKADRAVGDFTKNVGNYPKITSFAGGIRNLFAAFGLFGGLGAVAAVIGSAARTIREYQTEIVNLAAVAGKTRKEIAPLEAEIRKVAAASINSATDVAKLATELIKLGSTPDEAAKLLKPINDLSIALRASAEDSATLVKSLLNTFNEGADEAQRYTDVLAASANATALGFDELRDSLSYIAPAANAMGYSIERTAAMLGVLVDNGIKAESAGRLLRTMLGNAAKEGFTLEQQLEKVARSSDQVATSTKLFGAEGFSLGIILANNTEKMAALTKEFENSKGSLEELTNKQLQTVDAKIKIMTSSWEEFVLSVENGDGVISRFFGGIISELTTTIEWYTKLNKMSEFYNKSAKNIAEENSTIGFNEGLRKIEAQAKLTGAAVADIASPMIGQSELEMAQLNAQIKKSQDIIDDIKKTAPNGIIRGLIGMEDMVVAEEKKIKRITARLGELQGVARAARQVIQSGLPVSASAPAPPTGGEDPEVDEKKRLALQKKTADEYLAMIRKRNADEFSLQQFRIEREQYYNDLIVEDDKKTATERIDASVEIEQLKIASANNILANELRSIALSSEATAGLSKNEIKALEKKTEAEIREVLITQKLRNDSSAAEIKAFESHQLELQKIQESSTGNKQKIIDSDVLKFQKSLDDQIHAENKKLDEALEAEAALFNALSERDKLNQGRVKEHENKIYQIKKDSAIRVLALQVKAMEDLLALQDTLPEADRLSANERIQIEKDLLEFKDRLREAGFEKYQENNDNEVVSEKEKNEIIKQLSLDLKDGIVDLTNNIFGAKIASLDAEMDANNEHYARLIELAEGDQVQQDLLAAERDRKNKQLEKKKRKAEHDQAVFNKISALANVGIGTAEGIVKTIAMFGMPLATPYIAVISALGAIQAAAILATPIPKYEKGTKDHKGGPAIVGEVRPEVIIEPGRNPYIVDKPSILNLARGTEVIPSVNEYEKITRASIVTSLHIEQKKVNDYQSAAAFESELNRELLEELRKNTAAVKGQKQNVVVNVPAPDMEHIIWAMKQSGKI